MPRKTIAAVITNYNYRDYVADAINSALEQSLPFDQIIVVNDGSKDGSMDVINRYIGKVEIIDKANGGQLSACLAGMDHAKTDYVLFLDADDYVSPSFHERILDALQANPVKVQVQMIGVDARKNPLDSVFPTFPSGYNRKKMLDDNRVTGFYTSPPTSANIYRKDVLEKMGLLRIGQRESIDGQASMAAPYYGEIISINEPLSYYRVHGSNHSQWERPDIALLQGEVDWFRRRWVDTCLILGVKAPPFGDEQPLYILERRLMLWALGSGEGGAGLSLRFAFRLAQSHLAFRQKVMMTVWAGLILLPSQRLRRYLVAAKRSPINRPAAFNHLLGALLGRRTSPTPTQMSA